MNILIHLNNDRKYCLYLDLRLFLLFVLLSVTCDSLFYCFATLFTLCTFHSHSYHVINLAIGNAI